MLASSPAVLAVIVAAAAEKRKATAGRILMPISDAPEAMDTLYPFRGENVKMLRTPESRCRVP